MMHPQASKTVSLETGHEEMIHDAQLDYYGKRLATCSSDRSIRIFDVSSSHQPTLTSQIRGGHEGPVWQVGWAHPKFGSILASCSYDGRACVWKEQAANSWVKIFEFSRPDASINALQWAPHAFGLVLAVAAADGTVSVLTRKQDNTWDVATFHAHKGGVNSVSWGPDVKSGALLSQPAAGGAVKFDRKLLTGGCDNQLRLWRFSEENGQWFEVPQAFSGEGGADTPAHGDWVRDAAFAPSLGLPSNTIASCSEDKTVVVWSEDPSSGQWRRAKTLRFDAKVYRVSWSLMGNILAVAQGDNKVSLWKESIDGDWKNLSHAQAQHYAQQQPPQQQFGFGQANGVPLSPQQPQQPPHQQQPAHEQQHYGQQVPAQAVPHPQQHGLPQQPQYAQHHLQSPQQPQHAQHHQQPHHYQPQQPQYAQPQQYGAPF